MRLQGEWRSTGFIIGTDHPLYAAEINCEYVGRCEWKVYHLATGETHAEGVTLHPGDAQRQVAAAVRGFNP